MPLQIIFPNKAVHRNRHHLTWYLNFALWGQLAVSLGTDVSLYLPVTSLRNGSPRTLPPPPPRATLSRAHLSAQIKQNAEQSLSEA